MVNLIVFFSVVAVIGLNTLVHPIWLIAGMSIPMIFLLTSPIPEISIERILAVFLVIVWLFRLRSGRLRSGHEKRMHTSFPFTWASLLLMAAVILSLASGVSFSQWLSGGFIFWANRLLYLFLLFELINTAAEVQLIMKIIVISAVVLAVWVMTATTYWCGSLTSLRTMVNACRSILLSMGPLTTIVVALNTHAYTFVIGLLFSWVIVNESLESGKIRRIPGWVLLITIIFVVGIVIYADSRRGVLALIPIIIYIAWVLRRASRPAFWIFIVLLLLMVFVYVNVSPDPFRLGATNKELATGRGDRMPSWQVTWNAILKKPVTGWGAGSPNYAVIDLYNKEQTLSSTIMRVTYEMGFFGTIALAGILMALFVYVYRAFYLSKLWSGSPGGAPPIYLPMALVMTMIAIIAFAVTNNYENISAWYFLGVSVAAVKVNLQDASLARKEEPKKMTLPTRSSRSWGASK